ncbi:hypothetical protein SAMN05421823_11127 [Catalinimonas alkaloidigena]|uniref:Endonuclease/Exonuclease/phosphatase family protein n=1 Tax=Catalinimonas alkaloidigena TaxID=1075417 RepID=A0A1G9R457_9BACT|nr:hypothetical protein [Catalinimonas alkaloidigena]SDM18018.1 hypothetical protein SAMN05421823_11127 [Catalinimonas alkaloidigena]
MAQLRFAVWNVEWMNDLFTGDPPTFKDDTAKVNGPQRENTVAQRRTDVSGVMGDLAADVWVVVEGPNRTDELQLFFDTHLEGQWRCAVQPSGAQSVGLAVRTDTGLFQETPFVQFDSSSSAEAPVLKAATDPFQMDTDGDKLEELHKFERRPLYAELRLRDGTTFRVLGLHLKSKGVFGAYEWSKWWALADGNRKKIIAQCNRLREQFFEPYLSDPATQAVPLLVCGDINDGPGFDTSEMRLQASGVERLMGSIWNADFTLGNALFDTLTPQKKARLDFDDLYTASFKDPIFDGVYQRVWIDHILYTRNVPSWIAGAQIHEEMPDGQKIYRKYPHASDHFPVTCQVTTHST